MENELLISWNRSLYCRNDPINMIDPDDRTIFKVEVIHDEAVVVFHSDKNGRIVVPAALGSEETPSFKTGTRYIESVLKDPVNANYGADKAWDAESNPDNPYGPFLLKIVDASGDNAHQHIHGTSGGLVGKYSHENLGGPDANDRKYTHGCVRIPNEMIIALVEEGFLPMTPVTYMLSATMEEMTSGDGSTTNNNGSTETE